MCRAALRRQARAERSGSGVREWIFERRKETAFACRGCRLQRCARRVCRRGRVGRQCSRTERCERFHPVLHDRRLRATRALCKFLAALAKDQPLQRAELRFKFESLPKNDVFRQILDRTDPVVVFDLPHKRLITEGTLVAWQRAGVWITERSQWDSELAGPPFFLRKEKWGCRAAPVTEPPVHGYLE
jgi:hypothetical protein